MADRCKASNQIQNFKDNKKSTDPLTTSHGRPVDDLTNSLTAGARGPMLLQDVQFLDTMAHFDRERIPERVVHAKGAGAFGYFEVTHDISEHCSAAVFAGIGKQTPVAVRFSTVGGESGSADSARDPRGFAVKFYSDEGNWDLVGNNTPIFFIRDPVLFPSFIHTQKRNPVTHLKDPDMFWDFITLRQETTHQVCFLFSDRGTPYGYRYMNGYGSHTFKMVNAKGEPAYVKADETAKQDPDFAIRDLYNAIAEGNEPTWTLYIQVMTYDQAEKFRFNPFDLTKVWSQKEYPLIPVGKMVLNRNPKNYFAEVEQIAFSPANLVPGIEPSPDKMLQGRLFSYHDTHRHRLGANFDQIPVNCPYRSKVNTYQRDGPMTVTSNQGGAPNYYPNSFGGAQDSQKYAWHKDKCTADVARYNQSDEDNFTQVSDFWNKVLNKDERARLVDNIASHLCNAQQFLQERAIRQFGQVSPDFGNALKARVAHYKAQPKPSAAHL